MAAGKKTTWRWVHLKLSDLECKSAVSSQVMRSLKTSVSLTWPKNEWHLVRSFDWGTHIIYIYIQTHPSPNHASWSHRSMKAAQATRNHCAQCQIQHVAAGGGPMASCHAQKICQQHRHETRYQKHKGIPWLLQSFNRLQRSKRTTAKRTPLFSMNFSMAVLPPCSPNHHVFSTAFDHGAS